MKKILSIILSLVVVLSSSVFMTSAQEVRKIDPELQKILEDKSPDDLVDVNIITKSYSPNATEMPSWPDKSAARKELKEYYTNWYNEEIVPVVFESIEYKEVFVGSGIIIVSVKAGDIEKIASYDIVSEVECFENGVDVNDGTEQKISKIDPELQKILEDKSPDDLVDVNIITKSYSPNATEMPSWPDKSSARKELKEYYTNWYNEEIVPVVFESIEYKEVFVGSGIIVVSVKAGDIEKIASYDIVSEVEYFENGVDVNDGTGIFEEIYKDCYAVDEYYYYNELYYHLDDNTELDWVLVNAYNYNSMSLEIYMDIGSIVLYSEEIYSDFRYKYGVYDVVEGKFYDLFDLRSEPEKFDDLLEVLAELKIGRLIGDLDGDGDISIFDATAIQRCLAGLDDYPRDEYYSVYDTDDCGRMSDFDRDGDVSILDATAIQLELAKV